jgi:hypothetical protein
MLLDLPGRPGLRAAAAVGARIQATLAGTAGAPDHVAQKFGRYSSNCQNQKYEAISGGFVADETVNGEPVCEANSLRAGNLAGNFMFFGRFSGK